MHQYWVHPATVMEFMWVTKLLGTYAFGWQLLGLGLHAAAAVCVSVFATALTGSATEGLLSGIFFATTAVGADATGWSSAHVVLLTAIFLTLGMTYVLRKKYLLAALYIGIGFFFDPFRNFPVFLLIPFMLPGKEFKKSIAILVLTFLTVSLFTFGIFAKEILGSEFFKHLLAMRSPMDIVHKFYVVGNYFNSMANLMFGWVVRFPEDASTGTYNPVVARVGFVVLCIAGLVKKNRIVLFLFLWIIFMYIPNWLFEPRLTMGITHRYMVLSGAGFIILTAYILSRIKPLILQILLAIGFVAMNMSMANYYIGEASKYRDVQKVDSIWSAIGDYVMPYGNAVFYYTGEDPVKMYALSLSGPAPYGLIRRIADVYYLPIITGDKEFIRNLMCKTNVSRIEPGSVTLQKDVIPINHVYAWYVTNSGKMTNITSQTRKSLLISSMDAGCIPVISPVVSGENK
jgi:hypothetical protein